MTRSLQPLLRRCLATSGAPTISSLAAAVSIAPREALALIAPQQDVAWTYEELDTKARCLASGLEDIGYRSGDVAVSNVPNVAENLLLQLALSHIGASITTPPKDAAAAEKLAGAGHKIRGIICLDGAQPPDVRIDASKAVPMCYLSVGDGLRPSNGSVDFHELLTHCPPRGAPPAANAGSVLGIYGGAALTHGAALDLGLDAARELGLTAADRVCCSVTLMHAMGIGTSCSSALVSGAAIVLPAVGGIKGCGDPSQRASVTLEVLGSTKTTALFGDSHTLKALRSLDSRLLPPAGELALRTGVFKIGSGSSFLAEVTEIPAGKGEEKPTPLEFLGVKFHAMGKKAVG